MPRSIRSACIASIAIIMTSAAWLVATAAETNTRTPTKVATPAPGDACSLLTKQDAEAALGETASGPETKSFPEQAGATVSYCEYVGSGLHRIQLNLTLLSPKVAPMYRAMCAEKAKAQKGKDGLAGLGEVACWYDDKHEELHAFKGPAFISIELRRNGNPTEAIKGVMKKALDRLK